MNVNELLNIYNAYYNVINSLFYITNGVRRGKIKESDIEYLREKTKEIHRIMDFIKGNPDLMKEYKIQLEEVLLNDVENLQNNYDDIRYVLDSITKFNDLIESYTFK